MDDADPVKRTTFNPATLQPYWHDIRRRGKPKVKWCIAAAKEYWIFIRDKLPSPLSQAELDLNNSEHVDSIKKAAKESWYRP